MRFFFSLFVVVESASAAATENKVWKLDRLDSVVTPSSLNDALKIVAEMVLLETFARIVSLEIAPQMVSMKIVP